MNGHESNTINLELTRIQSTLHMLQLIITQEIELYDSTDSIPSDSITTLAEQHERHYREYRQNISNILGLVGREPGI